MKLSIYVLVLILVLKSRCPVDKIEDGVDTSN